MNQKTAKLLRKVARQTQVPFDALKEADTSLKRHDDRGRSRASHKRLVMVPKESQ